MRGQGLSWDHRGREVGVEITVSVSGGLLCHRPRVKSFHELLPLILMTPLCSRDLLFVSVFQMGKLRLREGRTFLHPTFVLGHTGIRQTCTGMAALPYPDCTSLGKKEKGLCPSGPQFPYLSNLLGHRE